MGTIEWNVRMHERRPGMAAATGKQVTTVGPSDFNSAPEIKFTSHHSGLPLSWAADRPAEPLLKPAQLRYLPLKRAMDVAISAIALVGLIPVFLTIAAAIALTSPGSVLFCQKRLGREGRLFSIYKFRTMYSERADLSGVSQTVDGDPRITAIGRWLRRTSLDELPQLFNVLRGDMSLIGPRPHVPHMLAGGVLYEELVPYYDLRLLIRPGLSGWAQVNELRGSTAEKSRAISRVEHDLAYVQNFSLRLDLQILWRTLADEIWRLGGH